MKKWKVMVDGDYEIPEWDEDDEDEGLEVCVSTAKEDRGCGWFGLKKILIEDCHDKETYKEALYLAKKICGGLNK